MTVIIVDGGYSVIPGETWRTQALALVPLRDDWTTSAPGGMSARALSPGTSAHVTGGHLVITGLPERALPGLSSGPAVLAAELRRPGSRAQRVEITIPLGAALPFTAPALAVASTSIALVGRVTAAAFPYAPVAGATVTVGGITTPLLVTPVPLALDHPLGTPVRVRALAPGAATTLAARVTGGDGVLIVASSAGIVPGSVLRLGSDLVVVDAVSGAVVVLRTPTVSSAPAGVAVTALTAGAIGAATTLARAAVRGDGVLLVAAALAGDVVEVVDGATTEFRPPALVTDADGRWRLAGVRGVPEMTLTTAAAGFLTDGPRLYPLAPVDPYVLSIALRT